MPKVVRFACYKDVPRRQKSEAGQARLVVPNASQIRRY
jgi:hypothetical protein